MDVIEAIRTRRSVRSYSPRAIPQEVLERMKMALRCAPSACNLQPWRFILVTDANLRRQIAALAHDQTWMADAPVIVVACGLLREAYPHMAGRRSSVEIDVAIALDHLTLAAVADGLGTCWIGAFSEEPIKRLLGIPADVVVVAMTPLGYPASPDLNGPISDDDRKAPGEIFRANRYE